MGFPHHRNPGDAAIWLGERATLARADVNVVTTCDWTTYDRRSVSQALSGGGAILLHGGGNLGDLWPDFQAFAERVIEDFPERPIVQLPQTLHFDSRAARDRSAEVFNRHQRLVLLLRDTQSLSEASSAFTVDCRLAIDGAFGLAEGLSSAPRPTPSRPILVLARDDREAGPLRSWLRQIGHAGDVKDWSDAAFDEASLRRCDSAVKRLRLAKRTPWPAVRRSQRVLDPFDAHASALLAGAVELIGSGEFLITDRLHGHILALMLGLPHAVVDNNYGKVTNFLDAWTGNSPLVTRVGSIDDLASLIEKRRG